MGGGFSEAASADCEASDVIAMGAANAVWMIFLLDTDARAVGGVDSSSLLLAADSPTIVLRDDWNPAGRLLVILFESEAGVAKDSTFAGRHVTAAPINNNGRGSMVGLGLDLCLFW